jgi:hypothetical protein
MASLSFIYTMDDSNSLGSLFGSNVLDKPYAVGGRLFDEENTVSSVRHYQFKKEMPRYQTPVRPARNAMRVYEP